VELKALELSLLIEIYSESSTHEQFTKDWKSFDPVFDQLVPKLVAEIYSRPISVLNARKT
jgi:hypothetical protein